MAIRISKKDRTKLKQVYGTNNKARKKYNRLRSKGVDESQLPLVPTSKKKLVDYAKDTNMSRADFNKLLDGLVDFATPRNPDYIFNINQNGVAISKTKMQQAEQLTKQAQTSKDEHYKELMETKVTTPTENSIVTPQVLTEFGADLPIKPIPDFDPDSLTSIYALDSYLDTMGKQDEDYFDKRDQLYYDNFRTTLQNVFNSSSDKIVNLLDEMGLDNFMKAYVAEYLDMNIDYIYDEVNVHDKAEETYDKIASAFAKVTGKEQPEYSPSPTATTINSETGDIVD